MKILFKHMKRGTTYEFLGLERRESDKYPMVAYRSVDDGTRWSRPADEFVDRFVLVGEAALLKYPASDGGPHLRCEECNQARLSCCANGPVGNHRYCIACCPDHGLQRQVFHLLAWRLRQPSPLHFLTDPFIYAPEELVTSCSRCGSRAPSIGIIAGPTEYTTGPCPECQAREEKKRERAKLRAAQRVEISLKTPPEPGALYVPAAGGPAAEPIKPAGFSVPKRGALEALVLYLTVDKYGHKHTSEDPNVRPMLNAALAEHKALLKEIDTVWPECAYCGWRGEETTDRENAIAQDRAHQDVCEKSPLAELRSVLRGLESFVEKEPGFHLAAKVLALRDERDQLRLRGAGPSTAPTKRCPKCGFEHVVYLPGGTCITCLAKERDALRADLDREIALRVADGEQCSTHQGKWEAERDALRKELEAAKARAASSERAEHHAGGERDRALDRVREAEAEVTRLQRERIGDSEKINLHMTRADKAERQLVEVLGQRQKVIDALALVDGKIDFARVDEARRLLADSVYEAGCWLSMDETQAIWDHLRYLDHKLDPAHCEGCKRVTRAVALVPKLYATLTGRIA